MCYALTVGVYHRGGCENFYDGEFIENATTNSINIIKKRQEDLPNILSGGFTDEIYKIKYLKYKQKYLQLKKKLLFIH